MGLVNASEMRWGMLRYAFVLVVLVFPITTAQGGIASYAFDKVYIVDITREALDKSPAWENDADNPPVAARKAIQLADAMKNLLVKDTADHKWKLSFASLMPAGGNKWYWQIGYEAEFQGGAATGIPHHLYLAVLMDGTVVGPEVRQRKKEHVGELPPADPFANPK